MHTFFLEYAQRHKQDNTSSRPEERRRTGTGCSGGDMEGGVLEVVGGALVRVPPRQREDGLVGDDEVGHPGDGGDDERLPGWVQVRPRPRQHPHARQLQTNRTDDIRRYSLLAVQSEWLLLMKYLRWALRPRRRRRPRVPITRRSDGRREGHPRPRCRRHSGALPLALALRLLAICRVHVPDAFIVSQLDRQALTRSLCTSIAVTLAT